MNISVFSRIGAALAAAAVLTIALLAGCASAPTVTPAARSELAPTGKLRVGLLVVSPVSVSKDGTPAEMQGVGVEIGRELAKQMDVVFEPIRYKGVASLLDGARNGEWDVAPIGYSADRTADVDFTAFYIVAGSTYLVPAGSPIRNVADVDKPGHRIAAPARSLQDTYLTANLKRAELVRGKTMTEAVDLLKSGKLHAVFAGEDIVGRWIEKRPEFREVEGRVVVGGNALAIAKGRPAGTAYAKEFIEYAKASGLIQEAIESTRLRGVSVAPAASTSAY